MKKTLKDLILEGGTEKNLFDAFSEEEKPMALRRLGVIRTDNDLRIYIENLRKDLQNCEDSKNEQQSAKEISSRKT